MAYIKNILHDDQLWVNQRTPFIYPQVWGNDDISNLERQLNDISLISKGGVNFKNFDFNDTTQKCFDIIHKKVTETNKKSYNFELDTYLEQKYIEYSDNNTPNFHLGIGPELYNQRKLTYIIHTNDPSEYEGGELHLFLNYDKIFKIPNLKGTIVIFPSFILHRITPVTKGTKKLVIGFVGGKPFK